jgi:hypothetical protein
MLAPVPFAKRLIFAIDRLGVDRQLMRPGDFPQQLPRPLPNISPNRGNRDYVVHTILLAVPDRVTSGLRILHIRSVRSPTGEGFTDPGG